MTTFATPGPVAATVVVAGARVRVTASDRTDTEVRVEPIDSARKHDVKVAGKTKVEFDGGRLSVKTTASGAEDGSVAITIDLPTGSGLVAYLAHSEVHAGGSLGEAELHVGSGTVRLDRIDALRASVASGEVTVGHIAGPADVDGAAFGLRIGAVEGPVELSNSGGQVWIGHAAADVTVTSATGAIRIGRLTGGRARLLNGSGDIEVGIDAGVAASVDAGSERGAVHDFVSSQPDPEPSGRQVMVHARTRHGDVIVQRAA